MAAARQRCPDIVVLPYNFARIKSVSETLYRLICEVTWVLLSPSPLSLRSLLSHPPCPVMSFQPQL
jgi:hypothetical protein